MEVGETGLGSREEGMVSRTIGHAGHGLELSDLVGIWLASAWAEKRLSVSNGRESCQ